MRSTELIKFLIAGFLSLAAVTALTVWFFSAAPMATANVRWNPSVTDSERSDLERRFSLINGEVLEGTTWRYSLRNLSRENIRALVEHAAVSDTHHIDRSNFLPEEPPPGVAQRIGVPASLVGSVGALALLGLHAARKKTVYLPQHTVTAILAVGPILLILATILTLILVAFGD